MMTLTIVLIVAVSLSFCSGNGWKEEEETPEYWFKVAKEELKIALNRQQHNTNVAKNIIIFLGKYQTHQEKCKGDGMSVATMTAGRILSGQLQGHSGEETKLAMDKFHHVGLSKTYAVDKQVADSGSTATAYLCGVKSTYYTIGVSGKARKNVCSSEKGNAVDSVLVDAFKAGKSTGVVTTTRINHATPAGAYAHSAHRIWYADDDLPAEAKENGCKDIAQQFYDNSHMITVALGGGRKYFKPNTTYDVEYVDVENKRLDGQDLIEKWKTTQGKNGFNAKYVWNKSQFDNVDAATTDRLLGMFQPNDMQYEADRSSDPAGEPSIREMTEKAIQILQKNSNGYFLLVEGGRIDQAHHRTNAYRALHDTVAFDKAIERAVEMTSDSDTLIIVTADHSHTFTIGGYSQRGNPIFGLVKSDGSDKKGLDGKPYTSLEYANGVGYQGPGTTEIEPHSRQNLTGVATNSEDYNQQTAVPLISETHGGDDVAILARGPMSHLFHGVHEQNYIAYVMRYASCIGSDLGHCEGVVAAGSRLTPIEANFLGMNLDETEIAVALYVQFTLLLCFLVLILLFVYLWHSKRQKNYSPGIPKDTYENMAL